MADVLFGDLGILTSDKVVINISHPVPEFRYIEWFLVHALLEDFLN